MIYFLRYATDDCPVKIGYTEDRDRLRQRLRAYNTHAPWPVEGLAYIDGGRALERDLHTLLATWRVRGEWFEPNEIVLRLAAFCRNNPTAARGVVIDKAMALVCEHSEPEAKRVTHRTAMKRARKKAFERQVADGSLVIKRLED